MNTVYGRDESWRIGVRRKGDAILLDVIITPHSYPDQKKFEFWGTRFEQLMTTSTMKEGIYLMKEEKRKRDI